MEWLESRTGHALSPDPPNPRSAFGVTWLPTSPVQPWQHRLFHICPLDGSPARAVFSEASYRSWWHQKMWLDMVVRIGCPRNQPTGVSSQKAREAEALSRPSIYVSPPPGWHRVHRQDRHRSQARPRQRRRHRRRGCQTQRVDLPWLSPRLLERLFVHVFR